MAGDRPLPEIRVEGTDDLHAIQELLHRHGILCSTEKLTIPNSVLRIIVLGDVDHLEGSVSKSIRAANVRAYGFVLDADQHPNRRWQGLRTRFGNSGVAAPNELPPTGFVGTNANGTVRVGVWIMPDNSSPGMLENFLQTLISNDDKLIPHAVTSTDKAKDELGAKFIEEHRSKARLHTWLAWQENPGRPFGVALKSRYF